MIRRYVCMCVYCIGACFSRSLFGLLVSFPLENGDVLSKLGWRVPEELLENRTKIFKDVRYSTTATCCDGIELRVCVCVCVVCVCAYACVFVCMCVRATV